jgi:hypothetical protein
MTTRSPPWVTIVVLGPPPSGRMRKRRVAPRLRTGITVSGSMFCGRSTCQPVPSSLSRYQFIHRRAYGRS